jgi:hypothetical protein
MSSRAGENRAKAVRYQPTAHDQRDGVMATEQDQFDAMDDQSLLRYLENVAAEREEHLEIEEVRGDWVAETWSESGQAGKRAVFRGEGADPRAAMLDLLRRLPSNE